MGNNITQIVQPRFLNLKKKQIDWIANSVRHTACLVPIVTVLRLPSLTQKRASVGRRKEGSTVHCTRFGILYLGKLFYFDFPLLTRCHATCKLSVVLPYRQ